MLCTTVCSLPARRHRRSVSAEDGKPLCPPRPPHSICHDPDVQWAPEGCKGQTHVSLHHQLPKVFFLFLHFSFSNLRLRIRQRFLCNWYVCVPKDMLSRYAPYIHTPHYQGSWRAHAGGHMLPSINSPTRLGIVTLLQC